MATIANQEEAAKGEHRPYFYYPAYGHKYMHTFASGETKERVYARRVLAGVVSGNKLYVGESICYTGSKTISPDQFVKRTGRMIAEGRAWKAAHSSNPQDFAVLVITIPSDRMSTVGKFFVEEVEKVYPKHIGNPKKAKHNEAPTESN